MATRKSTTKAKTKTTTAKTARASSTQAEAPKSNRSVTKRVVTMLQLRRLLIASSALYVLLAVAAGVLMNSKTYELTVGYLTKDELASRVATVFAPASRVLYDIEIRWAVVALLLLSAILPLLYLNRLEKPYRDALKGRVIPWRWIDLAISAALMTEVIALLSGVQDIMALKLIGGLMAVTAVLGWIAERQNENTIKPVWGAYITSLFTGILPWIAIAVYAIGTPFYGMVRAPWHVYALYAAGLIGFTLLAINQFNQHRRFRAWKDYITVERNYLVINLATKVAFAAILIAGLHR